MPANQIRVIGGRHRGRRLNFVPGRGLRPTPDRVRETLFNWLQADVPGARCLDLFAGSGALGLEAVSRGAGAVLMIEQQRSAAQRLRENVSLLREQERADVCQADAMRLLAASPPGAETFDIVFADPPFALPILPEVCRLLEQHDWLADGALVYLEQDATMVQPGLPENWAVLREGRAGQSRQYLLRRSIAR